MKHLFIINPVAGSKDRSGLITEAINSLDIENKSVYITECHKDAVRAVKERLENETEHIRIYACGGDGTFNEVVTGVYLSGNKNCSVAVVPIGSGNDFIKVFPQYTPSDFRDLRRLISGKTQSTDIMLVTDTKTGEKHISINVASAGFDSAVAADMNKYRRVFGGKGSYTASLAENFLKYSNYKYTIICDGENIFGGEKSLMFALGANGNFYGGAFKAAPRATTNDGYIDFIAIDRVSRMKFLKLVDIYKKGEHLEKAKGLVTFRRCKSLQFLSNEVIPFNVDGEIIPMTNPKLEIIPAAIEIVLP